MIGFIFRQPIFVISAQMVRYKKIDNRQKYDFQDLMKQIEFNMLKHKKKSECNIL